MAIEIKHSIMRYLNFQIFKNIYFKKMGIIILKNEYALYKLVKISFSFEYKNALKNKR